METTTYELGAVVPFSVTTGVRFIRLEMARNEFFPLAIVWYTSNVNPSEQGARIDLQKQVFLDDPGGTDRSTFGAEAALIVAFLHARATERATMVSPALASVMA